MLGPLRWHDLIAMNAPFLGLSALSQTLVGLVMPLLIQHFVGLARQGAYLGRLRLWGLMVALLTQAVMGLLSDRCTSRWGRRRPFILVGSLANVVILAGVGLAAGLEGLAGYWALFAAYVLLQVFANTAQAGLQGFIPDLVPDAHRGLASGIKALLEVPLAVILVHFTVNRLVAAGRLWEALLALMAIVIGVGALAMRVPDRPIPEPPAPFAWMPVIRLVLMTVAFTAILLLLGESLGRVSVVLEPVAGSRLMIPLLGVLGFGAMVTAVVGGVATGVWLSVGGAYQSGHFSFTWWIISRLAFLVGSTNLAGFALYFVQARLGFVSSEAAVPASELTVVVGVALLIAVLPGGWLSDRLGYRRGVAISGGMAAFGTLLMLLARGMGLMRAGAALVGLGTGLFFIASWALGTSLVPPEEAGRYLGLANLAGAGAGAVGAYLGGPLADFFTHHVPSRPGLGYALIYALYGLLFLVAVAAMAGVREPVQEAAAGPG